MSVLTIPLDLNGEMIKSVQFSPFLHSESCLCVYSRQYLSVGYLYILDSGFDFHRLYHFKFQQILHFTWLADSQVDDLPQVLKFAVGHKEGCLKVTVFTVTFDGEESSLDEKTVFESNDWIHFIAAARNDANLLAICGLDHFIHLIDIPSTDSSIPTMASNNNKINCHILIKSSGRCLSWDVNNNKQNQLYVLDNFNNLYVLNVKRQQQQQQGAIEYSLKQFTDLHEISQTGITSIQTHSSDNQLTITGTNNSSNSKTSLVVCSDGKPYECIHADNQFMVNQIHLNVNDLLTITRHCQWKHLAAGITGRNRALVIVNWNTLTAINYGDELHDCNSIAWHHSSPWLIVASGFQMKLVLVDLQEIM